MCQQQQCKTFSVSGSWFCKFVFTFNPKHLYLTTETLKGLSLQHHCYFVPLYISLYKYIVYFSQLCCILTYYYTCSGPSLTSRKESRLYRLLFSEQRITMPRIEIKIRQGLDIEHESPPALRSVSNYLVKGPKVEHWKVEPGNPTRTKIKLPTGRCSEDWSPYGRGPERGVPIPNS